MEREVFNKARGFVYRNARPLELSRWKFHFESGSVEDVLDVLSAYQNPDGGFAHALEADAWNPHSSPMQTWAATEILREIGFTDPSHPITQGILRYLNSGADFNGHVWLNAVPTNENYPHAPWWKMGSESTSHHDYNPTACLAGYILARAEPGSAVYRLGERIAEEAVDVYLRGGFLKDMHTVSCYVRLWEYCMQAGYSGIDLVAFGDKLRAQINASLTRDISRWETEYVCKPTQFFHDMHSAFYPGNEEISAYECDFILRAQQPDGSWNIPWSWATYPEAWAISKNWWRSSVAIANLRFLRGMGRLE